MYICKEVPDDYFDTFKVAFKNNSGTFPVNYAPTFQPIPTDPNAFVWDAGSIIKAMIFTTITICTIGGNGLVLVSMILKRNTLKSSTHYFIASLSLADFLVGILVMPFLAVLSVTGKWYFGQGYCKAFHSIHYWLCSASILSITAICIERYIAVKYPLKHLKIMNADIQRVIQACVFVWILAGILGVPSLFIWPAEFDPKNDYDCPVNFKVGHVVTVMVFIFYIPCAIMLGFYWQIYSIAIGHLQAASDRRNKNKTGGPTNSCSDSGIDGRKKELNSGSTNITNSKTENSSSGVEYNSTDSWEMVDGKKMKAISAGPDSTAMATNRQKQTSLSKKLFCIVGAFFICYFPFFTTFMVMAIDPSLVPLQLFIALGWIRYFNSCLNPMIYAAMLKPFREAFREVVLRITCRA